MATLSGHARNATPGRRDEEAQTSAQERMARLLSSSPAVMYSYRASGDFAPTFVSRNIKDWLGYEPWEYLENPDFWRDRVHPDDLAAVEAESLHLFEKGRHTVEYRFRRKDGSYRWVNDEQHLMRDEDGEPDEVVGLVERHRRTQEGGGRRRRSPRTPSSTFLARSPAVIYSFKASRRLRADLHQPERQGPARLRARGVPRQPGLLAKAASTPRTARASSPTSRACWTEGRLATSTAFRKKDGSYCWIGDELQAAARRSGRARRGRRRLERHHGAQAARRSSGRRPGPSSSTSFRPRAR
jgi:PAS domain S-box-containing protein